VISEIILYTVVYINFMCLIYSSRSSVFVFVEERIVYIFECYAHSFIAVMSKVVVENFDFHC
jgi:hypothetical protein